MCACLLEIVNHYQSQSVAFSIFINNLIHTCPPQSQSMHTFFPDMNDLSMTPEEQAHLVAHDIESNENDDYFELQVMMIQGVDDTDAMMLNTKEGETG